VCWLVNITIIRFRVDIGESRRVIPTNYTMGYSSR
jgi:hypothetical protein